MAGRMFWFIQCCFTVSQLPAAPHWWKLIGEKEHLRWIYRLHSTSLNLVHESFPESLALSRKSGEVIEQTPAICLIPCQKCSTLYPHTGSCTDFLNGICHLIRTQPGGCFSGPSCYDTTHFVALSNWFCSLVHQVSYHCFSFVFALAFLNSKFLAFIDIFYC